MGIDDELREKKTKLWMILGLEGLALAVLTLNFKAINEYSNSPYLFVILIFIISGISLSFIFPLSRQIEELNKHKAREAEEQNGLHGSKPA